MARMDEKMDAKDVLHLVGLSHSLSKGWYLYKPSIAIEFLGEDFHDTENTVNKGLDNNNDSIQA